MLDVGVPEADISGAYHTYMCVHTSKYSIFKFLQY